MSQPPPLMNWRAIAAPPATSTPPSAPPTASAVSCKKRITLLKRPKLPRGQAPSPDETPGAASDGQLAVVTDAADKTDGEFSSIYYESCLNEICAQAAEVDSEPDGARKPLSSKTLKERERAYEEAKRRIWTEQYGASVAFNSTPADSAAAGGAMP
eukprot:Gregarina_sp_Poly_1__5172@NODE_273_length_10223_cov_99_622391_g238_i0_p8_GENE_NODE_273_length_10223_cov_99_622391_g238_i0NODE_273_length_10223_cov_99_622391_g238_i0_p8_ORF_typecomplete_len156_score28_85SUZ/PF12752_7/1_9e05_NODE_273_length_10223_cov_99_622391_g238_i0962210089